MGRLPAVIGGGPTVPEMEQAGKATGPEFSGQPGCRSKGDDPRARGLLLTTGLFFSVEVATTIRNGGKT